MGEKVASEIWIGGRLKRRFLPAFCAAIKADQIGLDWAAPVFEPQGEAELLDGLNILDDAQVLHFVNYYAKFGVFPKIEEFLQGHDLPYDRLCGTSDCQDGALIQFRPGQEPTGVITTSNGSPVITDVDEVERAWRLLKEAHSLIRCGEDGVATIAEAADLLDHALPPQIPRLEPFEIVG